MMRSAAWDIGARPAQPPRVWAITVMLWVALTASAVLSAGIGAVTIPPAEVLAILASKLSLALPWGYSADHAGILLTVRLPRVLLGVLVGAGLSVAGGAMQGLFRNPLADPGLTGVSAGAALGAVVMVVIGTAIAPSIPDVFGPYLLSVAAFIAGLLVTSLVYRLSRIGGRTGASTMLLAGIAVNALAGAATGALTFAASDPQLRTITFWMLGSLGGATWSTVIAVAVPTLATLAFLPRMGAALNALTLGEAEAGHLGIRVARLRWIVTALCALAVGASVAVVGMIGFLPLVVPHAVRLLVGPDHRRLLVCSALLGATLLPLADTIARTVVAPAELPIGILTSLVGAPFFLHLLLRTQRGTLS